MSAETGTQFTDITDGCGHCLSCQWNVAPNNIGDLRQGWTDIQFWGLMHDCVSKFLESPH